MLNNQAHMIHTPKHLLFTLGIRSHEVRQPKTAQFQCFFRVLRQLFLHFRRRHLLHDTLRLLLAEHFLQSRRNALRLINRLTLDPESLIESAESVGELVGMIHFNCG